MVSKAVRPTPRSSHCRSACGCKNPRPRRRSQTGFVGCRTRPATDKRRGSDTMTNHLRKVAHLTPLPSWTSGETGCLKEPGSGRASRPCRRHRPETSGQLGRFGRFLMIKARPGIFVAASFDWEAPTGGYLLRLRSRQRPSPQMVCLPRSRRATTIEPASRGFLFHCPPSLQKCDPPTD